MGKLKHYGFEFHIVLIYRLSYLTMAPLAIARSYHNRPRPRNARFLQGLVLLHDSHPETIAHLQLTKPGNSANIEPVSRRGLAQACEVSAQPLEVFPLRSGTHCARVKLSLMKPKDELISRALFLFDSRYNCAESVLLAAAESLRKCCPFIPSMATAFGAGIGRRGSVCGALTGAIMALGLAYGRSKPSEDREKVYGLALELYDRFTEKFGSAYCHELTDCDLTTPEGREKFQRLDLRRQRCPNFVSTCAEILAEVLSTPEPQSRT